MLGDLAAMDLDAAREAAAAAKAQVAEGLDPAAAKRARRAANIEASASRTVTAAIERFTEERGADWTAATHRAFRRDFAIIRAAIGDVPLALVDRGRLVALLAESIAPDGTGLRQATRIAGLLGSLWRQAGPGSPRFAGWGWPGVDPVVADRLPVAGRHRITARKRVLSEARDPRPLAGASRARPASAAPAGAGFEPRDRRAHRGAGADRRARPRPRPAAGCRRPRRRPYLPHPRGRGPEGKREGTPRRGRRGAAAVEFAVGLLRQALAIRRGAGPHVFEARLGPLVSGDVTRAWGALVKRRAAPSDATPHDLRRSMRTHLGELDHGGSYEDEERLMGHAVGAAVAQAYDRGRRLAKLRPLADTWGERLAAIVGATPAEVVALAPAADGRP